MSSTAQMTGRYLVVDVPGVPGDAGGATMLIWNSYAAVPPAASVSAHLEQHGERLRAKYLAFVFDLGQTKIAGRTLVEHFRRADGFSFWWMNRVAEKSPFKSRRIFDCLRLLALEEMLVAGHADHVTLLSADRNLADAMRRLCDGLGAAFEWRAAPAGPASASMRGIYDALPHWLQGLLSFRHLIARRRFTSLRPIDWASGSKAVSFCSYLFNLNAGAAARGEFHSHQWEGLPPWLRDHGFRTNWVHQFLPDGGRTVPESVALLQTFNKDAGRQGSHVVLETYLTWATFGRIAAEWFRHVALGWRLRAVSTAFTPEGSRAWLWPLLRQDWQISISGTAAVTNCACAVLLDEAVKDLPHQERGLFLFEGQGWETAFVHSWRTHGHGEIVGVPHSSMPFWYLSIYDDARSYEADGPVDRKPLPDRWAVNGQHAWAELARAGLPSNRMVPVEALRFQHLARLSARPPSAAEKQPVRLLLLGDFTRGQTLRMIRCLEAALARSGRAVEVAIKRHPVCPLGPADAGALRCEFVEQPLGDVVTRFDVAFASNTTSACLDAWLAGLPVIVFLDDADFNQCPLRGAPHVRFVNGPVELAAAIGAAAGETSGATVDDFFWVDETLPRWSALLTPTAQVHG